MRKTLSGSDHTHTCSLLRLAAGLAVGAALVGLVVSFAEDLGLHAEKLALVLLVVRVKLEHVELVVGRELVACSPRNSSEIRILYCSMNIAQAQYEHMRMVL